jgi:large subunit ribosomal protein L24
MKKKSNQKSSSTKKVQGQTLLKKGDRVMVISGGNKDKRPIKGQTGKIIGFVGKSRERALVEGLNLVTRHTKAKGPGQQAGKIVKEAPIHVARLMYYVEKISKPVRLCTSVLGDGTKVRGYRQKEDKAFVQLAD